jgi:predicted transposase/invertase (TIGR01784 family)
VKSGINPCVDYIFKKLFGSEDTAPLLVSLLNAVVGPTGPVTGVQIVLPQTDKAFAEDKLAIGDVKARDQGNRQFQLEMQWQVPWFFAKRVLFYWGKFHPQQLREGEHYITLRPTISICFTNQILFPVVDEHHLVFCPRERNHAVIFCEDLEIHLIELPKFKKTAEQLTSTLDRWCYFLRHGAELNPDQLPASLDVPEIRQAVEVLAMFTKDENEREIYELRLKYQRDHDSIVQYAKDAEKQLRDAERQAKDAEEHAKDAEKQAKDAERQAKDAEERGVKKGVVKGLIGQVHLCQKLLKQPPTPQEELSALPVENLTALLDQLQKQLLPNGD